MEILDNLKSLPKDYIKALSLKILLALMSLMAIGSFLMFVTVVFLYLHDYSVEVIVLGAFLVWAFFLGIISALYYIQLRAYERKKEMLSAILTNKEAIIGIGLSLLNKFLGKREKRKLRKASE